MLINELRLRKLIREMVLAEAHIVTPDRFKSLVLGSYSKDSGGQGVNQNEIVRFKELVKNAIEDDKQINATVGKLKMIIDAISKDDANFKEINHAVYWGIEGLPTGERPRQERQGPKDQSAGQERQEPREPRRGRESTDSIQERLMKSVASRLAHNDVINNAVSALRTDYSVLIPLRHLKETTDTSAYLGNLFDYYPTVKKAKFQMKDPASGEMLSKLYTLNLDDFFIRDLLATNYTAMNDPQYPYRTYLKYSALNTLCEKPVAPLKVPMGGDTFSPGLIVNANIEDNGDFVITLRYLKDQKFIDKKFTFDRNVNDRDPFIKLNPELIS